jgi:hypothetical protein
MRKKLFGALTTGLLVWSFSAHAIYREPTTPTTDQSEELPNNTIKLDSGNDMPSGAAKKKKTQEQHPERTQVGQHLRSPQNDRSETPPGKGASPEAGSAIGTMIGIGVGIGLGRMGGRGDDTRMRDR